MRESQIKHEAGSFWVGDTRSSYTVYRIGVTASSPDSSYARDTDGLSLAIARCDYLAKRHASMTQANARIASAYKAQA